MTYRILVVEDEKEIQSLIVEEFEDEGYEVKTADNGKLALDCIEEFKPNIIVSDITMPILNGHELLVQFRNKFPHMRSVPFIFLSALADRRHILEGKKLGVDDYITKPIDFEMLLVTVQTRLREVDRMTQEKEEQMVSLYTKVMETKKQKVEVRPVLIVTNQWMNMSSIEAKLKELELPFITQYRGSKLDEYLNQQKYSSILLTDTSDDLSAKIAMHRSKAIKDCSAQKILILDKTAQRIDKTYWSAFDAVAEFDEAPNLLQQKL